MGSQIIFLCCVIPNNREKLIFFFFVKNFNPISFKICVKFFYLFNNLLLNAFFFNTFISFSFTIDNLTVYFPYEKIYPEQFKW
jgi:hypothetical protein